MKPRLQARPACGHAAPSQAMTPQQLGWAAAQSTPPACRTRYSLSNSWHERAHQQHPGGVCQATTPAAAWGHQRLPCTSKLDACRHGQRSPNVQARASSAASSSVPSDGSKSSRPFDFKLLAFILLVLVLGVSNRVLYRVALVPMANYIFFLATFQNIGYLAVYFTTLALRYRAGLVTDAMLAIDKRPLWAIGACEAIAQLLFMVSASHLPGPLLPVINQSYLCWNLLFASIIMRTRFTKSQLGGAALITVGVMLAAVPPSASLLPAAGGAPVQLGYVVMSVLCFAFPALASIIKDLIFRREKERLGQPLDIFMVNSFGSLYQSVFVLLLLPVNLALVGVALPDLPSYLHEGARCFQGLTPACGSDCAGAPVVVVAYVAANLAFNVAMLVLLRSVGTVSTTLAGSCLVPLTILAFMSLPLPLPPSVVGPWFAAGSGVLCLGLLLFNYNIVVRPLLAALPGPGDSVDLPAP